MFIIDQKEEKGRILKHTIQKFFKEGFYKTTMDEIASELKISKKTIYKYFSSKDELLDEVVKVLMTTGRTNIESIADSKYDAVKKLITLKKFLTKFLISISPKYFDDMRLYGKGRWEKIDEFRTKLINKTFERILVEGKRDGLIRDFPNLILITMIITSIRSIVNPTFLINSEFTPIKAANAIFEIIFSGILTAKGKTLLKKYKKSESDEEF